MTRDNSSWGVKWSQRSRDTIYEARCRGRRLICTQGDLREALSFLHYIDHNYTTLNQTSLKSVEGEIELQPVDKPTVSLLEIARPVQAKGVAKTFEVIVLDDEEEDDLWDDDDWERVPRIRPARKSYSQALKGAAG